MADAYFIYKSRNYSGGLDLLRQDGRILIYKSRNYSGGLDLTSDVIDIISTKVEIIVVV